MEFTQAGAYGTVDGGRLFGPSGGLGGSQGIEGFFQARRNAGAAHERRVREAARLYADALNGKIDQIFLREAMYPRNEVLVEHLAHKYPGLYGDPGGRMLGLRETMSVTDYQALFVDVLDRIYYGYYSAYPIPNKGLVRIHQLRDFRLVSRYLLDGLVTPLTSMDAAAPPPQRALQPPVPQDGATYAAGTNAPPLQYQPLLYQAMTSVNWRAIVNDDLGIFRDLGQRLAIAGNRGIHKFISGFYMDVNGPNASLYTSGYGNIINTANGASVNNPPLNAQGISDAFKILAGMKDSGGDPILMTGQARLWYGPAYTAAAQNLKRSLNMYLTQEGGVSGTAQPGMFVNVENWLMQDLELVLDPYIPVIAPNHATSWGITIDPNSLNRPSVEVGFLNGYEEPQIFSKVPNTQRMGGGVDPTLGDFYTMDSDMKIVTVMGGKAIDGRSTVASNGSGT
jgi:hypothetical protein